VKILWHSVAPWVGTGYGQQTATFTPRLRALGHDVAISAHYGLQGSQIEWQGITCYPAYETGYGTDVIVTHALDHFKAEGQTFWQAAASGLIVTLCDVWVLNAPLLPDMSVAAWTPVDHLQLPGLVRDWYRQTGAAPIAMSRHGQKALADEGLDAVYVPHGIDTTVFAPGDQTEARERTGVPRDAFVVAMVAANNGVDGNRKAFSEQITAFAELRRRHPDAFLVLHTDVDNPQGQNLRRFLERLPDGSYTYSDQYAYRRGIPADTIADIYRSADVLTNCSWGEGFGIPIVEAQACGTPVVVTDGTAMPELCGAGWRVGYEPLWHENQSAWAIVPRIGEIIDAYEQAYDHAAGLRDQAREFGLLYDADFVTDVYWQPVLKVLGEALERRYEEASNPTPPRRRPSAIREADGFLWVDRGKGTGDMLGPSAHEHELVPIIDELVPQGGIVLDVGAHVGHWTLRLADKAERIIAVEANPDAASVLRRNLALNDIGNVEVLERAAWDACTMLRLDDPNDQVAGGSTRTLPSDDGDGVLADRLDGVPDLRDLERLDLIKLDVEGADLHALRGMSGLLERHQPTLFVETHDCYGYYTRAELEQTLTDLGYKWSTAFRYQTRWSPDGPLDEPVDADYLVCTPKA
jgi:FkbM family methyltransferase